MKQRLVIWRPPALIHEPRILIVDEPWSGWTRAARATLRTFLRSGENGTTIFLSTHAISVQKRSVTASASSSKAAHRCGTMRDCAGQAAGNHGQARKAVFFGLTAITATIYGNPQSYGMSSSHYCFLRLWVGGEIRLPRGRRSWPPAADGRACRLFWIGTLTSYPAACCAILSRYELGAGRLINFC